jgi:hypothetical protein
VPASRHDPLVKDIVLPAIRKANAAYTEAARAMHAAKDERRKQFNVGKGMIGIHGLMDEFGMSKQEVEAVIDGRD